MESEHAAGTVTGSGEPLRLRIPSLLRCGLLLLAIKSALKFRGFGWTVEWVRHHVGHVPAPQLTASEAVIATEHAVAMAAAFFPGRARCLEQSLVLYYLLRGQGVLVSYCQGVRPHPFTAHAWVEYRNEPVNDVLEHVKLFMQLPVGLP
jgi:hypothetical protein